MPFKRPLGIVRELDVNTHKMVVGICHVSFLVSGSSKEQKNFPSNLVGLDSFYDYLRAMSLVCSWQSTSKLYHWMQETREVLARLKRMAGFESQSFDSAVRTVLSLAWLQSGIHLYKNVHGSWQAFSNSTTSSLGGLEPSFGTGHKPSKNVSAYWHFFGLAITNFTAWFPSLELNHFSY